MTVPKIKCLYDKLVPIDDVIPHPDNENKHSSDQARVLSEIMRKDGITHAITVSNISGYISMGHARLMAFRILQLKEVPVQFMDFDDSLQEFRVRNSDNNIARYSEFDRDQFELNLEKFELSIDEIDFEDFGKIKVEIKDEDRDSVEFDTKEPKEEFMVLIECVNENAQQHLYDELDKRGFKCKLMS